VDAQFEQRLADSVFYLDGAARFIGFFTRRRGARFLLDGSVALLPAAFYNFAVEAPSPIVSIVSVLLCVAIMCVTLYFRLKPRGYNPLWTIGWTVTIIINMSLYARSINLI